jgi:hypothetical protein
MASGKFELSSDLGSVEQQYAPKGYRYFLSTTRTLTGGYHEYTSSGSAMFVLDATGSMIATNLGRLITGEIVTHYNHITKHTKQKIVFFQRHQPFLLMALVQCMY